jgi:hypothetical protein
LAESHLGKQEVFKQKALVTLTAFPSIVIYIILNNYQRYKGSLFEVPAIVCPVVDDKKSIFLKLKAEQHNSERSHDKALPWTEQYRSIWRVLYFLGGI